MKIAIFFTVLCLIAFVNADKIMNVGNDVPSEYKQEGEVSSDATVNFIIALYQRNIDQLHDRLMEISDPTHEDYGKWLSRDTILDMVSPVASEKSKILNFLKDFGLFEFAEDLGDSIRIRNAPIRTVEKMFSMEFKRFIHRVSGVEFNVAQNSYVIPEEIESVVQFVSGLTGFPVRRRRDTSRPIARENQVGKVTPSVLRRVYGTPLTFSTNSNSSLCLAEFQDDTSFNPTDLSTFEQNTDLPSVSVAQDHIVGPYQPDRPDGESTLDVQYGVSMALNSAIWFWTADGWMYDWATDFFSTDPRPYIVSMSWGWTESNQCQITSCSGITSEEYVSRTNAEFLKITSAGTTLLAASGDQGAPGDGNPYCFNSVSPISSIFPGASPYVLAVGATALQESSTVEGSDVDTVTTPLCKLVGCSTSDTEIACSFPNALITSGGGFSAYTPVQSWQKTVVDKYLATASNLPTGHFNANNRGFPDVSALGHNYVIRISGEWELVDGTSASTPVFAGILTLINDARINAGKSPLGFVNPAIYQAADSNPKAFTDITSGNNMCTESCCTKTGYTAQAGWDAVTGLGTPVWDELSSVLIGN